ncbi:hypothetical protein HHK36_012971 [Tetracentron sinense]|uniref:Response regulatory domain-containing protein n=1 Tax=Tetracentron sinense TaxID=13715 RepID=A0A834Z7R2_TETSI|nr:hypothetical protein HHK36_012971 [Tetracentron sinense]
MKNNVNGNGNGGRATAPGNVESQKKKLTALVVDNDNFIRMLHKVLLNNLNVESQVVENGKEAVDLCLSGAVFDLILICMKMPVMDGPDATRALRTMGVRSMIVGVTAYSKRSEKQEFMDAGLDDYHEKPLTAVKLISLLRDLRWKPIKHQRENYVMLD